MKLINQGEMKYLIDCGFKVGEHIHATHSNKHKYYATESPKVLEALNAYHTKTKE